MPQRPASPLGDVLAVSTSQNMSTPEASLGLTVLSEGNVISFEGVDEGELPSPSSSSSSSSFCHPHPAGTAEAYASLPQPTCLHQPLISTSAENEGVVRVTSGLDGSASTGDDAFVPTRPRRLRSGSFFASRQVSSMMRSMSGSILSTPNSTGTKFNVRPDAERLARIATYEEMKRLRRLRREEHAAEHRRDILHALVGVLAFAPLRRAFLEQQDANGGVGIRIDTYVRIVVNAILASRLAAKEKRKRRRMQARIKGSSQHVEDFQIPYLSRRTSRSVMGEQLAAEMASTGDVTTMWKSLDHHRSMLASCLPLPKSKANLEMGSSSPSLSIGSESDSSEEDWNAAPVPNPSTPVPLVDQVLGDTQATYNIKPDDLYNLKCDVFVTFRAVDLNGDQLVSWDNFVDFVIDSRASGAPITSTAGRSVAVVTKRLMSKMGRRGSTADADEDDDDDEAEQAAANAAHSIEASRAAGGGLDGLSAVVGAGSRLKSFIVLDKLNYGPVRGAGVNSLLHPVASTQPSAARGGGVVETANFGGRQGGVAHVSGIGQNPKAERFAFMGRVESSRRREGCLDVEDSTRRIRRAGDVKATNLVSEGLSLPAIGTGYQPLTYIGSDPFHRRLVSITKGNCVCLLDSNFKVAEATEDGLDTTVAPQAVPLMGALTPQGLLVTLHSTYFVKVWEGTRSMGGVPPTMRTNGQRLLLEYGCTSQPTCIATLTDHYYQLVRLLARTPGGRAALAAEAALSHHAGSDGGLPLSTLCQSLFSPSALQRNTPTGSYEGGGHGGGEGGGPPRSAAPAYRTTQHGGGLVFTGEGTGAIRIWNLSLSNVQEYVRGNSVEALRRIHLDFYKPAHDNSGSTGPFFTGSGHKEAVRVLLPATSGSAAFMASPPAGSPRSLVSGTLPNWLFSACLGGNLCVHDIEKQVLLRSFHQQKGILAMAPVNVANSSLHLTQRGKQLGGVGGDGFGGGGSGKLMVTGGFSVSPLLWDVTSQASTPMKLEDALHPHVAPIHVVLTYHNPFLPTIVSKWKQEAGQADSDEESDDMGGAQYDRSKVQTLTPTQLLGSVSNQHVVVTADKLSRVKVWDTRMLRCIETMGLYPSKVSANTSQPLTSTASGSTVKKKSSNVAFGRGAVSSSGGIAGLVPVPPVSGGSTWVSSSLALMQQASFPPDALSTAAIALPPAESDTVNLLPGDSKKSSADALMPISTNDRVVLAGVSNLFLIDSRRSAKPLDAFPTSAAKVASFDNASSRLFLVHDDVVVVWDGAHGVILSIQCPHFHIPLSPPTPASTALLLQANKQTAAAKAAAASVPSDEEEGKVDSMDAILKASARSKLKKKIEEERVSNNAPHSVHQQHEVLTAFYVSPKGHQYVLGTSFGRVATHKSATGAVLCDHGRVHPGEIRSVLLGFVELGDIEVVYSLDVTEGVLRTTSRSSSIASEFRLPGLKEGTPLVQRHAATYDATEHYVAPTTDASGVKRRMTVVPGFGGFKATPNRAKSNERYDNYRDKQRREQDAEDLVFSSPHSNTSKGDQSDSHHSPSASYRRLRRRSSLGLSSTAATCVDESTGALRPGCRRTSTGEMEAPRRIECMCFVQEGTATVALGSDSGHVTIVCLYGGGAQGSLGAGVLSDTLVAGRHEAIAVSAVAFVDTFKLVVAALSDGCVALVHAKAGHLLGRYQVQPRKVPLVLIDCATARDPLMNSDEKTIAGVNFVSKSLNNNGDMDSPSISRATTPNRGSRCPSPEPSALPSHSRRGSMQGSPSPAGGPIAVEGREPLLSGDSQHIVVVDDLGDVFLLNLHRTALASIGRLVSFFDSRTTSLKKAAEAAVMSPRSNNLSGSGSWAGNSASDYLATRVALSAPCDIELTDPSLLTAASCLLRPRARIRQLFVSFPKLSSTGSEHALNAAQSSQARQQRMAKKEAQQVPVSCLAMRDDGFSFVIASDSGRAKVLLTRDGLECGLLCHGRKTISAKVSETANLVAARNRLLMRVTVDDPPKADSDSGSDDSPFLKPHVHQHHHHHQHPPAKSPRQLGGGERGIFDYRLSLYGSLSPKEDSPKPTAHKPRIIPQRLPVNIVCQSPTFEEESNNTIPPYYCSVGATTYFKRANRHYNVIRRIHLFIANLKRKVHEKHKGMFGVAAATGGGTTPGPATGKLGDHLGVKSTPNRTPMGTSLLGGSNYLSISASTKRMSIVDQGFTFASPRTEAAGVSPPHANASFDMYRNSPTASPTTLAGSPGTPAMRPTSKSMVQFRAFCDDDDDDPPPPPSRPTISVSIPHFQVGDTRKAGRGEVDHVPAVTVTNPDDDDDDSDASNAEVLLKPFQSVGSVRHQKSVVILQKRSMSSITPKFTVQSAGSEKEASLSGPRGVQAAVLAYTKTGGMSTMRPSSAKPTRPHIPIRPNAGSSSFSTPRSITRPGSSLQQQRGGIPHSPRGPN